MRRLAIALVASGVIVALAGATFALQGVGLVGPVGGLMYQNPVWVVQGEGLLGLGVLLCAAGFWLGRRPTS